MYLVDTSVWIDFLRDKTNPSVHFFEDLIDNQIPFGITGMIYQEILQGAATQKDFNRLVDYLTTQHFFHAKDVVGTYESAAKIYFNCRRRGVTVRSTSDCFIAQIAIDHDLTLLHNDQDFVRIKKIIPTLKLCKVRSQ